MIKPPGKGTWQLDLMHFPRPATPLVAHIYRKAFAEGWSRGSARVGSLLDHLDLETVDGWIYQQPVIVGAPRGAATPPRAIFFLVSRLHPAIRARGRAALRAFADEPWRQEVARWNTEIKPARIAAHRELLASDVRALDDASLVEHATRCIATFEDSARSHGEFTVPALLPVGDLIAHAVEWTGEAPARFLALVAASSPISAGDEPTRSALLDALRVTPEAMRVLELADPREVLEMLTARTDEVGSAARSYIDTVGHRALNACDVTEPVGVEVPFVLVEGLRAVLAGRAHHRAAGAESLVAVRDRVPAAHRDHFDRLLACARTVSAIRDERSLFNDYWSAGVTRRAVLEIGRRVAARGLLPSAGHAIALLHRDPEALLLRGDRAAADAIIARFEARQRAMLLDMPAYLGPPPAPPPPAAWMPRQLRRMHAATLAALSAVFDDAVSPCLERDRVHGIAAASGSYAGPARVVRHCDDFHRLRPGDVLVARATSPAYNVVLPLLGAIVTDRGGALSHAAIISREYGIPAIVGCRNATARIVDGARTRVDGSTGVCELLS